MIESRGKFLRFAVTFVDVPHPTQDEPSLVLRRIVMLIPEPEAIKSCGRLQVLDERVGTTQLVDPNATNASAA
jgi:hypothetical protein